MSRAPGGTFGSMATIMGVPVPKRRGRIGRIGRAAAAAAIVLGGTACSGPDAGAGSPAAPARQGSSASHAPIEGQEGKDVVWIRTPQPVVERMLDMAKLAPGDRLVDLGSGDGVTVIAAARRGAIAHGIEFDPELVALSRRNADAEGVSARATFEQADIFESDFSEATIVTLFLLPSLNLQLRPTLLDMPPGTRVVSNTFDMGPWEPDEAAEVTEGCTTYCDVLLWIVPAKVAGTWDLDGRALDLVQDFQAIKGSLGAAGAALPVSYGRLEGARIRFSIGGDRYVGEVEGDRMRGTINGSRPWQATRVAGS